MGLTLPLPKIRFCLVCDGVRQEVGGKLAVLGLYGALPDVSVLFGKASDQFPLTFVFLTETAIVDANPSFEVIIRVPDGSTLATTQGSNIRIVVKKGSPAVAAITVLVRFVQAGPHRISVLMDGTSVYEQTVTLGLLNRPENAG
jgi:hypothetical protein